MSKKNKRNIAVDNEPTNDYIEEENNIVEPVVPEAVVVEQFQAKHDLPIAKKLKLPNRKIY